MTSGILSFFLLVGASATANASLPDCVQFGDLQTAFNTKQVVELKRHSADGTQSVALIRGTFIKAYEREDYRIRFKLKIGARGTDTVEVYYYSIEPLPRFRPGDQVIACGIYETRNKDRLETPRSPDDAVIFDTNFAWKPTASDGFLVVNGVLYNR